VEHILAVMKRWGYLFAYGNIGKIKWDIGAEFVEVQSQMKNFREKVINVIFVRNVAASPKKRC